MCLVSGGLLLTLIVLCDMHLMTWSYNWRKTDDILVDNLDADVKAEILKVDAMTPQEIGTKALVVKHLRKNYKGKAALRDATFTLQS